MSIKPKLNYFDTTVVVISLVIGIGIFRVPAIIARETGNPYSFFLVWILGGIVAILGGLVFAEIGARKPLAGGFYKLVSEAYHPAFAFMVNWLGVTVTCSATYAAVALLGAEYISPLLPLSFLKDAAGAVTPEGIKIVASVIIAILFLLNILGIKSSSFALNVIMVGKISVILFFVIMSFFANSNISVPETAGNGFSLSGFLSGLVAVFFTYGGYQLTTNLSADVKNPKKILPLGIVSGVFVTLVVYLLINIGYYKLLGFDSMSKSNLIAADFVNIIFGSAGSNIISVIIFISAFGFLNVSYMHIQRTFYAMAEDNVLPGIFMKVNPKTQAQNFSLLFITILILLFIFFQGSFDKILNLLMFNDTLTIAIVASTVFVLRKKMKSENYDGFKIPFYPVVPAVFILFLLLVSFSAFAKDLTSGLISVGIFILSYPLYLIIKTSLRNNSKKFKEV